MPINPLAAILAQSAIGGAEPQLLPDAMPGVPLRPQRRPGIQTTVYRADPGTRDFVFDQRGLEAPGAAAKLEDRLAYQQQLIDAMQSAGGTLQNSPQMQVAMAQQDAGRKAMGDQMAGRAQMAQAQAQQTMADVEGKKVAPEYLKLQAMMGAAQANPALFQEPAYQKAMGLPATFTGSPVDLARDIPSAIAGYRNRGIQSVAPGSPEAEFLMRKFGPDMTAALGGQKPHWWGNVDPALVQGFIQQPGGLMATDPGASLGTTGSLQSIPPSPAPPTPGLMVRPRPTPGVALFPAVGAAPQSLAFSPLSAATMAGNPRFRQQVPTTGERYRLADEAALREQERRKPAKPRTSSGGQ